MNANKLAAGRAIRFFLSGVSVTIGRSYACDSKGIPHSRIFIHDLHNIWMSRYFGLTLFFVLLSDSGPLLLLEV